MAKIEGRLEREMEVKVPLRLEVVTGSGDISVDRGEDGKLRVTSEFEVRAGSQKEAEELARMIKEDPPIEVEGDLVRVGGLSKYNLGTWPAGPSAVLDFSVSAPFETEARIKPGPGDLDLGEIGGEVSVRTGSGDAHLRSVGSNVNVAVGSGDVSLESDVPDGAEWILKAGSGDVGLLLPGGSRFNLRAPAPPWGKSRRTSGFRHPEGLASGLRERLARILRRVSPSKRRVGTLG